MKTVLIMTCAAVVLAAAWAPAVETFDTLLPEDTLLYVSVRDVPSLLGKIKATAGYKIFEELKLFDRIVPENFEKSREFYRLCVAPLGQICRGEVAFAITRIDAISDKPELVLLVDVSEREAALQRFFDEKMYPLFDQRGVKPEKLIRNGIEFTRINPDPYDPERNVVFVVEGGVLMASQGVETLEEVIALRKNAAPNTLRGNVDCAGVLNVLGDADVQIYLDFGAVVKELLEENDGEAAAWTAVFGLDQIRAIGLGLGFGPEGGTTTLRLSTDGAPRGWIGALVRGAGRLKSIKYAPDKSAFFWAFKLESLRAFYGELAAALESVREGAATEVTSKLETLLGMSLGQEVLPAFGGEVAVSVAIPETLDIPPAALLIEIKDKPMVEKLVARVLELVESPPEDEARTVTTRYRGTEIIAVPVSPAMTPGVAVLDDFLVVATRPDFIEVIIDTVAEGPNLGDNEDFRAAMAGLPVERAMTLYVDLKGIYDFVLSELILKPEVHEELEAVSEHLSSISVVLTGDEQGLTFRTHSPSALFEPGWTIGVGLMAPVVVRSREKARMAASLNNLKQLSLAIHQYAENHDGRIPEKMSDLAPAYAGPFLHPKNWDRKAELIDLERPETIDAHTDYEIVLKGKLDDQPYDAVVIREKRSFSMGGRCFGYVDGHVEFRRDEGAGGTQ